MSLPSAAKTRTALTLAAGAAAAVTAQQAGAAVIYTPLNAPVNAASPTFAIDYDHDGTNDVSVKYDSTAGLALSNPTGNKFTGYINNGTPGLVKAMAAGDTIQNTAGINSLVGIGPGSPFPVPADGTLNNGTGTGDFTVAAGERYIGMSLVSSSGVMSYGWIGFHVEDDSSLANLSGTVTGFAYEDSGLPIAAGAVPEPSSLGLLAMGATGLAAYRRRGR